MERVCGRAAVAVILALGGAADAGAQVSFRGLGPLTSPGGVSGDGRVVVGGESVGVTRSGVFRWTAEEGLHSIAPHSQWTGAARAANADGSVIVGTVGNVGFRWTAETGYAWLGPLMPGGSSAAADVSADGRVFAGWRTASIFQRAVRHAQGGELTEIWHLPNRETTIGSGVSDDGGVVVGWSALTEGNRGFRFTDAGGLVLLRVLPGGTFARATAVSGDGRLAVGYGTAPVEDGAQLFRAVRWRGTGEPESLGVLPGAVSSRGLCVSGDGWTIGGASYRGRDRAVVWTRSGEMIDVLSRIEDAGLIMEGWALTSVEAISADGSVLVGQGRLDGVPEGWIARVPELCAADFNGVGGVGVQDLLDYVGSYLAGDAGAEMDGLARLSLGDLLEFVRAFAAGCTPP